MQKEGENLDRKILEALYKNYYRELYLYAYSMCGKREAAEDILQEAFLKACTALKDSHTNMRAWLYLVVRNLCINYWKKEKRTELRDNLEAEQRKKDQTDRMDPLEYLLKNEEQQRIWEALQKLDSPGKEILVMMYAGQLPQKEIAAILHMTPENVRVHAYRAKRKMRKWLQ